LTTSDRLLFALQDFNLTAYIADRWYIQQQMPVSYLDEDSLYCVSARYEVTSDGDEVTDIGFLQPLLGALKYNPGEVRSVYSFVVAQH
jgi:hypothetical protein